MLCRSSEGHQSHFSVWQSWWATPFPRRDSKSPSRKYQEQTRQIWNSFKTNMLPSTKKQQHFIQMAVFQRLKAAQSCNSKQIFLPRNPPRMQRCTRLSSQPRVQKQAPAPTDNPQGWHTRICRGLGPKHLDAFCLKGSWGQLSKSAILTSKLPTPGPKPLLWSVLVLGHTIKIAFIPKPHLRV